MIQLVVESGSETGKIYPIEKSLVSVGRSVTNAIQIVDRKMSRNHAEVHFRSPDVLELKDLGSRNGTLLNGKAVKGTAPLQHHDRIQFGDTILRVEIQSPELDDAEEDTTGSGLGAEKTVIAGDFLVIKEKQWGATRSQRRAGYDPVNQQSLEATSQFDIRQPNRRLEILYQITETIRSVFNADELLDKIMSIIQVVMKPDRTYLLLTNPDDGEVVPRIVKVREGDTPREIKISMSIVSRCMTDKVSLLVSDAAGDDRFNASESVIRNSIRTAMVAPLIFKEECLGVIYVDNYTRVGGFREEELELITSIANQAAVAITNANLQKQILEQHKIAREMEIARGIQTNLLPKVYPSLIGYEVSAMSLPAKQVGGDYYDFLSLPDGRMSFAIADVSGKGVAAAILTATTRSYLKSETQHLDIPLSECVSRINRMVCRDVTNDMYVTLFMAALDASTGRIEYVNAGHCHPVVLTPEGDINSLTEGGIFLGIDPDLEFLSGNYKLLHGGLLVLFTDGVTDVQDSEGNLFGRQRFLQLLIDNRHKSAEDIRNAIYQECMEHKGTAEQFDDFTLIVVRRYESGDSDMD